ncbi:MAG: transposase [Armatimonadetes bacterium]|nr:transposase [Armatimonadota bacterium]
MASGPGFYDPDSETARRHGANLPHWSQAGATYYVTFRLADSLPEAVLAAWERERAELLRDESLDDTARERQTRRLYTQHIEAHLDLGHGACWLGRPECAAQVANTLRHFDGERYRLWAWCVMPNHVHVMVEPLALHSLSSVLHSWRTFAATGVNRLVGRRGALWQKESFDHLVRRQSAFDHFAAYILSNPRRAGLRDWPYCGGTGLPASDCSEPH